MRRGYSARSSDSELAPLSPHSSKYPAAVGAQSSLAGISTKFSLGPDPQEWGTNILPQQAEADDHLHDPRIQDKTNPFSLRGVSNLGCLLILCVGLVGLFAGYPIVTFYTRSSLTTQGGFNIGGINGSGQIPSMSGNWGLIDVDTPRDAYTKPSWNDGSEMQLVFSDEFNVDGRSFYPGDDPYWEAVDLHYWATKNLEWYDPAAITTNNGSLVITLSRKDTHNLTYEGGLLSSWNKFCFTGGYMEASVQLPGANNILGLWPAIWTMGNLGRAGFGASLEGMWPYTYDSCDVGTAPNQTVSGRPETATVNGDQSMGGALSYLPGQRLSRCTCAGESHPGPVHADGTYVGRAAPEIDMFEALINGDLLVGQVSQTSQWAPFNEAYHWFNNSDTIFISDPSVSEFNNDFIGSITQQASSVLSFTNPEAYEDSGGGFAVYGFEYRPGFDNGYISWINDNKLAWGLKSGGFVADPAVEIGPRPVPQEPMYMIANLGMSRNFGFVDLENLPFPVHMRVDYIRVYQPSNAINIGCDPKDFPTKDYINQYLEAYTNADLTTWVDDFKQPFPKNSFLGEC